MTSRMSRFLLCRIMGWTISDGEDNLVPEKRVIFLAAPHTSIFDFVIGYLYLRTVGGYPRVMIKKEAFFFPLGPILKAMGGFPIDRKNPQEMLMNVIHEMESEKSTYLVMCPEGTRKAIKRWKTGYHMLAQATGAAVYLGHYDYRKKTLGHGRKFEITSDARADTERIQQLYEEMGLTALHPEGYTTK